MTHRPHSLMPAAAKAAPRTRQLPLELPSRAGYDIDDFFVSPANERAFAQLMGPGPWPGAKLVLTGPPGSGKTHLARVWAARAGAARLTGRDLRRRADVLTDSAAHRAVLVDDAHRVARHPRAEETLFHLHNMVMAAGGTLLLTAPAPPSRWGLALPDLASRMQACAIATLSAPDDALLSAVLVKLFADRQVAVPPNLIPYLVTRMERSLAAAEGVVALLDRAAMAQARPITRALAADVLSRQD
ncbi:AAA family ATPase [Roseicitreum antarcticum]|uniref:DnaA regulatory inactivator Hda n=1 Tax=Roseicitreum antarcticum TaxID=564137 RepID=A0A1H2VUX8_9RHOB|nr:DnaA/Hda family protein [Roseicitreum antarcticum]SDW72096.1 DnaA regulatory inactivator Hda [Roseicitreum antarcticum]